MIKIDWQVEESCVFGEFLYFHVSAQVRTKIKLAVIKISMKIPSFHTAHLLCRTNRLVIFQQELEFSFPFDLEKHTREKLQIVQ